MLQKTRKAWTMPMECKAFSKEENQQVTWFTNELFIAVCCKWEKQVYYLIFSEYVFLLCEEMGLPTQTRFLAIEIFDRQVKIRLVLGVSKAVNFSTCTINSSRRFMAKHICDLYELIRSNSETNLQRNWKEVENRVKTQLPLRVMSCVQLASKLTSHYKVKSSELIY